MSAVEDWETIAKFVTERIDEAYRDAHKMTPSFGIELHMAGVRLRQALDHGPTAAAEGLEKSDEVIAYNMRNNL